MTGRVYDEGGVIRQGKEAVEVWRSYFEKVLNEGGNSEDQGGDVLGGESSWIDEGITREEVVQALGKLKRRAAPGTDGLTAEMVGSKELVDFWYCLFNWCWANGMIPTEWRKSVIVPIPKKSKGCVQDGRVSRNILSNSSIQSGVWHYPREVDTGSI